MALFAVFLIAALQPARRVAAQSAPVQVLRGASPQGAPGPHAGAGAAPLKVPQLEQAFRGYNAYLGAPLADGLDPGFLKALLFEVSYASKNASDDGEFWVPDGVRLQRLPACSFDFKSDDVSNTSSYEGSLHVFASVDLKAGGGAFSASTDYTDFVQRSESRRQRRAAFVAECQQYQMWHIQGAGAGPPLSGEFRQALHELGRTPSAAKLFDLFDTWGTHFAPGVALGARYGQVSYLTEQGQAELEKMGVSVKTAASWSGTFSLGGKVDVDVAKNASNTFTEMQASEHWVSVGESPPKGDDKSEVQAWAEATQKRPVLVRYTLASICALLGEAQQACEDAAPGYCPARLDAWQKDYPEARCGALTTTVTTTTTISTDCLGCPPQCCAGGCAGDSGQWTTRQEVTFEGFGSVGKDSITVGWSTDTCAVTQGQPFGQDDFGPSSGPAVETPRPSGLANRLVVHAGLAAQTHSAQAFTSGLRAANVLGAGEPWDDTPDELSFALAGTLTLSSKDKGLNATFRDFRLGQGEQVSQRNWWIGAAGCTAAAGHLECTADEHVRVQIRAKSGEAAVFQVAFV